MQLFPGEFAAPTLTGEATRGSTAAGRYEELASDKLIYLQRARGRLWLQLLDWIAPGQGAEASPDTIGARLEHDPTLQALTQRAVDRVASELGLSGSAAVMELINGLSHELSYIDALRFSLNRFGNGAVAGCID